MESAKAYNVATIAIRTESHPFKVGVVYRAYEIDDNGKLDPLYIGRESVEELKKEVARYLSHKIVIFAEI